jgi:cytoskeleton protein RodZ
MSADPDNKIMPTADSMVNEHKPGALLRRARLAKGFSEEKLCQDLGVTRSTLIALELDQMEKLPSAVYVRGYIRRYCGVVGLRPSPVLASFDDRLEQLAIDAMQPVSLSTKPGGLFKGLSFLSLMLASTLIFSAVFPDQVYFSGDVDEPVKINLPQKPSLPIEASANKLVMTFSEDTWLQVVDARDHILAVNLYRAGETLNLDGQPPYLLSIDNSAGLDVFFDNKQVTLPVSGADKLTEFTVGQ